jgi:hypothetical protein
MRTQHSTLKNLLLTVSLVSTGAFLTGCGDTASSEKTSTSHPAGKLGAEVREEEKAARAAESSAAAITPIDPTATSTPTSRTIFESVKDDVMVMRDEIQPAILAITKKLALHTPILRDYALGAEGGDEEAGEYKPGSGLTLTAAATNFERMLTEREAMVASIERESAKLPTIIEKLETQSSALASSNPSNVIDRGTLAQRLAQAKRFYRDLLTMKREMGDVNRLIKQAKDNYREELTERQATLLARDTMNEFISAMVLTWHDREEAGLVSDVTIFDLPTTNRGTLVSDLVKYMTTNVATFRQAQLPTVQLDVYRLVSNHLQLTLDYQSTVKERTNKDIKTYAQYLDVLTENEGTDRFSNTRDVMEGYVKGWILEALTTFEPVAFYFNDGRELASLDGERNTRLRQFISNLTIPLRDITSSLSLRATRVSSVGQIDLRGLSVSGVSGDTVALGLPLFVQMKGSVDSGKTTEAALGSVAYRLGNTVVGALQAYANRGVGFGLEGQQFESSVMVSHSFGSVFLEGQIGSVSASDVHFSDWSGLRSQMTLGLDTAYVSPFVQVTYRQLDRDGHHQLKDTTASVGLDMDISSLSGDTYHIDSRLLTKVGYGEKAWSQGSRDLGHVTGLQGSVEWSASLNLNSGITFSTSLGLDTVLGSNAGITVRLEQ